MIRVVITGGPSTGKTSVIEYLKQQGFKVFNEVARKVIQQQIINKTNKVPWDDVEGFSKLVLSEQLKDFNNIEPILVFYDRGIPDILGYLNHGKKKVSQNLKASCLENRYQYVFILPPWKNIYITDNERRETFEESKLIYNQIERAYLMCGYKPINVPLDSIENRAKFIQKKLNE